MKSTAVTIRFYEELNDFLNKEYPRRKEINFKYPGRRSVKDLIESFNIPHVEVDLILINGKPEDFDYIPGTGDRISVYPVFESLNIEGISKTGKTPLRNPKFILDVHLGKLCRLLRLLGFDTDYDNRRDDPELAKTSRTEERILLTRDRGLLKRKIVSRGILIRSSDPMEQALQILDRLDIRSMVNPFSRCSSCGRILESVSGESIKMEECLRRVPPGVSGWCRDFTICPNCRQIFWKGSHREKLEEKIKFLLDENRRKEKT